MSLVAARTAARLLRPRAPQQSFVVPMLVRPATGHPGDSSFLATLNRGFAAGRPTKHDNSKAIDDLERHEEYLEGRDRGFVAVDEAQKQADNNATDSNNKPAQNIKPEVDTTTVKTSTSVTSATVRDQQKILFPRLTEEATDAEIDEVEAEGADAEEKDGDGLKKKEVGFKYLGKEPTAYGDWSHKGRVTDF